MKKKKKKELLSSFGVVVGFFGRLHLGRFCLGWYVAYFRAPQRLVTAAAAAAAQLLMFRQYLTQ